VSLLARFWGASALNPQHSAIYWTSSDTERQRSEEWPAPPSRATVAWRDIAAGFSRRWMWVTLALQDMKLRYRGSTLGPFWVTLSTLVMILAMGLIYPRLFHINVSSYLPYLAIGLMVWQLIGGIVSEGCDTFVKEEGVIRQVPIPFSIHAYRCVCRNFLVFAHTIIIIPIGWVIFHIPIDWRAAEVLLALPILAINGFWVSMLLGMVSARFRDVPPIVANLLQTAFFLTPVFWHVDALGDWKALATLSPLFAAIDVVRAPLLGVPVSEYSWPILLVWTIIGAGVTFAVFARFRMRIAYWI
jgi:ABC-type polysaccharide/polyol phosphate export permease